MFVIYEIEIKFIKLKKKNNFCKDLNYENILDIIKYFFWFDLIGYFMGNKVFLYCLRGFLIKNLE